MTNTTKNSDDLTGLSAGFTLQNMTGEQVKAARALLGWEQADLARAAGVSVPTINRMENMGPHRCMVRNLVRVQRAFAAAGVDFTHERQDERTIIGVKRNIAE